MHWSRDAAAVPGVNSMYFLKTESVSTFRAAIEYGDGSSEELPSSAENALRAAAFEPQYVAITPATKRPTAFEDLSPAHQKLWSFPWWMFHAQVRLASGQEGLLVDCGAMADLCGDRWASRVQQLAASAGQGTKWSKIADVAVEGVGKSADIINDEITLPICLEDGAVSFFKAIVAKDSELPALYGLNRMTQQQAIVDTGNDKLILPGPGGIRYTLSPGSRVYPLQRALSGHLLLPCAEWQKAQKSAPTAQSSQWRDVQGKWQKSADFMVSDGTGKASASAGC